MVADELVEIGVGVARFLPRGFGTGLGLEVITAFAQRASLPIRKIGVGAAPAGTHRGAIDRFLEALRKRRLGRLATLFRDDLRGDVAPGDEDQLCHTGTPTCTARRLRSSPP